MIVVDTNVVAELMKPEPNEVVRRWSLAQQSDESYTTAITLAEILYGIERLTSGSPEGSPPGHRLRHLRHVRRSRAPL